MGFQIHIISTVEDIRTKSMFIMHFGRYYNWIGKWFISMLLWNIIYYYENLAIYYSHYDNSFFNMTNINMQLDTLYSV